MMKKLYMAAFLLSLTLLAACSNDRIFEENIDFNNRIWQADSLAQFKFRINDSIAEYNLYFNIRNTIDYPFHNIYIQYNLQDSTGNILLEELVNKNLFAEKTGEPLGDGLGDIFSHQFPLVTGYEFPHAGLYQLNIQQYMRMDSLSGVVSLGARVTKASEDE